MASKIEAALHLAGFEVSVTNCGRYSRPVEALFPLLLLKKLPDIYCFNAFDPRHRVQVKARRAMG